MAPPDPSVAPSSNARRKFLVGAGAATAASAMVLSSPEPAAAVTTVFRLNLKDDFGAVGDGVADDTAAVQAAVNFNRALPTAGVRGFYIYVPKGRYRLTATVSVYRSSVILEGDGSELDPTYATASNGGSGGSCFVWDGLTNDAMFEISDSHRPVFRNLRFEGKDTMPPLAAIRYRAFTGAQVGTNAQLLVEDCHFGVYTWTRSNYEGALTNGILIDGDNINNDEWRVQRCTFQGRQAGKFTSGNVPLPAITGTTGINAPTHTQSVWSSIQDCLFTELETGVRFASSTQAFNLTFNSCGRDIELVSTNSLFVYGYHSENAAQFARLGHYSKLFVYGGRLQCTNLNASSGAIFDLYPTASAQTLHVQDVEFFGVVNPASTIRFGTESTGGYTAGGEPYSISIRHCEGLKLENIEFAAAGETATNTTGTVEWDMRHAVERHTQFRNEFHGSVAVGAHPIRTTLDKTVWELPPSGRRGALVADQGASTFANTAAQLSVQSGPCSIPAGHLAQPGDQATAEYGGEILNNSGSTVTLTSRFKLAGTALHTVTLPLPTGATPCTYQLSYRIVRVSATTVLVKGAWTVSNAQNTGILSQQLFHSALTTVASLDTSDLALDTTLQFATAHALREVNPALVLVTLGVAR